MKNCVIFLFYVSLLFERVVFIVTFWLLNESISLSFCCPFNISFFQKEINLWSIAWVKEGMGEMSQLT